MRHRAHTSLRTTDRAGASAGAGKAEHRAAAPRLHAGVLYAGRYQAASTLRYSELIVAPAMVRHGLRWGAWISHIYVDDERSAMGGRSIWGLPKQLACFEWNNDETAVTVFQHRHGLCRLETQAAGLGARLPLLAPAFGARDGMPLWFYGRGSARLAQARLAVEVADRAPFARLGFASGRGVCIEELKLSVRAPR